MAAAGIDRLLACAARKASNRVGGIRALHPFAPVFKTIQANALYGASRGPVTGSEMKNGIA